MINRGTLQDNVYYESYTTYVIRIASCTFGHFLPMHHHLNNPLN